jgi:Tetratricopeptide Repeats-Sensor
MPRPLCFMIMPYGRKPTQAEAGKGPAEINFDALWDRAYEPAIKELGYEPVRADQDTGSLIINQMIERLYFADLVLADMTIPNGNVYYEVGIRHAAKGKGCVLLAAEWSKPLFDVAQMRSLRYPLPEGEVVETTAQAIVAAIKVKIETLAGGLSPVHGAIKGYPTHVDQAAASTMKDAMLQFAAFQGEIRALRGLPRSRRMDGAKQIVAKYWTPPVTSPTALALLRMLKDSAETADDWTWVTRFIEKLPEEFKEQEEARELEAFALSNAGKHVEAIAKLEGLVAACGPTPERLGILGGRYKRLFATAQTNADRSFYLDKCIDSYERGMELDLNEYYCSSNLPRLYRRRNSQGDAARAHAVSNIVIAACERAKKLGVADEWLRPTLLGTAFDDGDCQKAAELAREVAREGAARWKLDSTLNDLKATLEQQQDAETKTKMTEILTGLEQLC